MEDDYCCFFMKDDLFVGIWKTIIFFVNGRSKYYVQILSYRKIRFINIVKSKEAKFERI
jgi:hypothetical protein